MPHILVIEDDARLRGVLARVLRIGDYEVTEAADGPSGVACWHAGGADLVVTDFHMVGGMDGVDVMLQLRAHAPALPIIIMSGSAVAADTDRLRDARLANVAVLQKPFSLDTLTAVVRSALDAPQQRQA
jgi:CheY-like chemotaxis protein